MELGAHVRGGAQVPSRLMPQGGSNPAVTVFKLVQAAAKTWRRLKGTNQLSLVIEGVTFTDGVAENDTETCAA